MKKKVLVIRIGGSLLYSRDFLLNKFFLSKLKSVLITDLKQSKDEYLFAFVTGGGLLTRSLIQQVLKINPDTNTFNEHYIGLKVTHVNKAIFNAVMNRDDFLPVETFADAASGLLRGKHVIIAGEAIGHTTDLTASEFANFIGAQDVYKLTNVEGIYDKDPSVFKDAKLFKVISWEGYAKLFGLDFKTGQEVVPGMHAPIDFKCAKFCFENGIKFHVSGGKNFEKFNGNKLLNIWQSGTLVVN